MYTTTQSWQVGKLEVGSRVSSPERLLADHVAQPFHPGQNEANLAAGYMAHQAGFGQEHVKTK